MPVTGYSRYTDAMGMKQRLFPRHPRSFPAMRWVNITLRTLHLIGIAGLGGAYLYAAPRVLWEPYLWLTLFSGVGMMATAIYTSGVWLVQLRGLAIMLKLMLLAALLRFPGFSIELGVAVIVLSSIIAHAPGNLRYFSIWHRRRIEFL